MRRSIFFLAAAFAALLSGSFSCDQGARSAAAAEPADSTEPADSAGKEVVMKLISTEFDHGEMIPAKFTSDGRNANPPLRIEGVPAGAVSLVLIVDDPDAPGGTWDHWIVFNIPPDTAEIKEHSVPGTEGTNSFGRLAYGGPSPPSGTHRYYFKLYALDRKLDLKEDAVKADVEKAMKGHILAQTELMGKYKKKR